VGSADGATQQTGWIGGCARSLWRPERGVLNLPLIRLESVSAGFNSVGGTHTVVHIDPSCYRGIASQRAFLDQWPCQIGLFLYADS